MTTILTQVEACLNSRPLVPLNTPDDDVIEVLTPGHFLVGQPLCTLPDRSVSSPKLTSRQRWQLCQAIVHCFWKRWSHEYLNLLNKYSKWHRKGTNLCVGDIVILKEENTIPTKWPLGRVISVHPGKDQLVRVADIKTAQGVYRRPVTKLALLLAQDEQ